jgi:hypothetical protein
VLDSQITTTKKKKKKIATSDVSPFAGMVNSSHYAQQSITAPSLFSWRKYKTWLEPTWYKQLQDSTPKSWINNQLQGYWHFRVENLCSLTLQSRTTVSQNFTV